MDTRPLLYGLIGFFIGGFLVSVAATTFNKPVNTTSGDSMTMADMATSLQDKKGDDFDKAFIAGMIEHHQGAIDMAELAAANAKHDEIKNLSQDIITAQQKEISQMKQWQADWGYSAKSSPSDKPHNTH